MEKKKLKILKLKKKSNIFKNLFIHKKKKNAKTITKKKKVT